MDDDTAAEGSDSAAAVKRLADARSDLADAKVFEGGGWREEGMTRTLYLPPVEGECGGPSAGHILSLRVSTPAGAQIEEVVH